MSQSTASLPIKHVVVFGGTFNPIHFGHLRSAWELKQQLHCDEVRLIPCFQPTHRDQPSVNANHRLAMVKLALNALPSDSGLVVDDIEIRRDKPTYTVDTLTELHQHLSQQFDEYRIVLTLAVGTDAFAKFTTWHEWQTIMQLANIVIMQRPDSALPEAGEEAKLLQQHRADDVTMLSQSLSRHIFVLPVTALAISSTKIRQAIATSQSPYFLTPDTVLNYINKHNLYV